jgi:anticodon binding domain
VGESEMEQNLIALKNMTTGEQQQVSLEQLIQLIQAQ